MTTSIRDVLKTLNSVFASTNPSREIPASLESSIQNLLDKDPRFDGSTSQRVHDELAAVYTRLVSGDANKTCAFLQVLLLLQPYLIGDGQKLYWYRTVIYPILDEVGRLRVEIDRASAFMLAVLDYDADEDDAAQSAKESQFFTATLLEGYVARTTHAPGEESDFSWENEHIASQFEHVLVNFGRKKPKDLMLALDRLLVQKRHRPQALALLTVLVREQPPHLHQVSQTPLIQHLLQCLMIDTSTTVVQLALTALVMFLPHIPSAVKVHLPRLFLIYSRLLCWDQLSKLAPEADTERDESEDEQDGALADESWQKLYCSPDGEASMPLDMIHYFTFLYGLYPLNFTSFIRKPRRYLKSIQFPRAEQLDLDQDLIKDRTEPFRQRHLLHPNFYFTTMEEEIEEDRFLSSDASDVVAECIGLVNNIPSSLGPPRPPPNSKLPEAPAPRIESKEIPPDSLLGGEDDVSMIAESNASTAESLPLLTSRKQAVGPSSQNDTFGVLRSRSVRRAQAERSRVHSPARTTPNRHHPDSPTLSSTEPSIGVDQNASTEAQRATLQRQLMILRNDLNYERYLKQQHLAHIGQLQRRHVADATLSANTENLLNLNKSLKSKLAKSNDAYATLKRETATGRAQSKEFEVKLSSRVRTLREAERNWTQEREELRVELERSHNDNETLRQLVVESESRELLSRQRLATMEFELDRAGETQERFHELEGQVREQETKAWTHEQAADKHETARLEFEALKMQLQAQRAQTEAMRLGYEERVSDLEKRATADGSRREQDPVEIERAIKAATARYGQLKRDYIQLKHDNVELELRCKELESEAGDMAGGMATYSAARDEYPSPASPSPGRIISPSRESPTRSTSGRSSLLGSSSAPAKQPPPILMGGRALRGEGGTRLSEAGSASGVDSDVSGTGSFYQQKKSAFSADSLDSGHTGMSSKSAFSSKSGASRLRAPAGSVVAAKESEKKKKKAQPKTGGIRGIRGLM